MNQTLIIIVAIAVIAILYINYSAGNADTFSAELSSCKIDEDCQDGDFCYMGRCWGYWKGYPMPWSNCRNPYCTSIDPHANCSASRTPSGIDSETPWVSSQGKCMPYCKCTLNRRPGGSIDSNCFPTCGKPCMNNDDCPPGCPACSGGICSAPNKQTPVL